MKAARNAAFLILLATILLSTRAQATASEPLMSPPSSCYAAGCWCPIVWEDLPSWYLLQCTIYESCETEYPNFCDNSFSACERWCGFGMVSSAPCDPQGCTAECHCWYEG